MAGRNALNSVQLLLSSAIDYAGLFPPASVGMNEAIENYAGYCAGEYAWALGRFIVPASRLYELLGRFPETGKHPLLLSVVGGADPVSDMHAIVDFERNSTGCAIDAIEWKVRSVSELDRALSISSGRRVYLEIPIREDIGVLIEAIASRNAQVKVRTGGVTPDTFPSPLQLAHFILLCAEARVPFKATAGLHHPLRSVHPLTYEISSPSWKMHGFLNVLFASAAAYSGSDLDCVEQILQEEQIDSLEFDDAGIGWRGLQVPNTTISEARERLVLSFGSCSFQEPISEMKSLKLL